MNTLPNRDTCRSSSGDLNLFAPVPSAPNKFTIPSNVIHVRRWRFGALVPPRCLLRFIPDNFKTYVLVGSSARVPLSGSRSASLLRWILRSSTFKAQSNVRRTSRDGKVMPLKHRVSWRTSSRVPWDSLRKFSTRSSHPSETNRIATIVASIKGRARLGLLDRIFLRDVNLRVLDLRLEAVVRSGVVARCHNV